MSTAIPVQELQIPDAAKKWNEKASDLYKSKEYSAAMEIYSTIIDQFGATSPPSFIRSILCNRAACFTVLARYVDATEDLTRVIQENSNLSQKDPVTLKARLRLARCHWKLGRNSDALRELDAYRDIVGGPESEVEISLRMKTLQALNDSSRPAGQLQTRTMRYEVRLHNADTPFVRYDNVPAALCVQSPPEIPAKMFLMNIVNKYDEEIKNHQRWNCWNCGKPAVSITHTPMSWLHKTNPTVVDIAQPVCTTGGPCDAAARNMVAEEMRLVAAQCSQST